MRPVRNWLLTAALLVTLMPYISLADVLVEDFRNAFGDSPIQNHLGAAAGYSLNGESGVALGGGEWFCFNDLNGSEVNSGGVVLDDQNLDLMVTDSQMSVNLKTVGSLEQYPYAGVGCTILGDKDSYVDLTKVSAIQLRVRGTGTVTMEVVTEDIDTLSGGNDWGFYSKNITLSSNWITVTVPVNELVAGAWSYAEEQNWTWSHGRSSVQAIQFLVTENADVDLEVDSISLIGIEYTDFGFVYKDQNTPDSGPFDISLNKLSVVEKTAGYEIAPVTVFNYDENLTHTMTVNDSRFEIINGMLKLKDSESLLWANGSTVTLTLTATDSNGDSYSESFTLSVKAIIDGDVIKWGGSRSSTYGAIPFLPPSEFNSFIHRISDDFPAAEPAAIWIVGTIDSWGNCQLEFPSDGNSYNNIGFNWTDKHEEYLTEFDRTGNRIYLQVESGMANVNDLISIIMNRYGHHPCVAGFAVDVEWFQSTGETNTTVAVTDAQAQSWDQLVKSFDSGDQLVLKHWMTSVMPSTYRSDIIFLDDSQAFPDLTAMCDEFKVWADTYSDNPVMFQIGYDNTIDGNNDYSWWSLLANPPKEMGEAIAATINNPTQELGIIWVDFTMHYSELEKSVVPDSFYLYLGAENGTVVGSGMYEDGEYATITATADSGYVFSNWVVDSGSVTIANSSATSTTILMSGDAVVTALFELHIPVLEEVVTETHLLGRDTTRIVDTSLNVDSDTLVVTTSLETIKDTTITQTDSLSDQVVFWTHRDTAVAVTITTIAVDTIIIGAPILEEVVTETVYTGRDTTQSVDTALTPELDTLVVTTTVETIMDTTITQTDSLRDQVVFWTHIDTTLQVSTDTIAVDTVVVDLVVPVYTLSTGGTNGTVTGSGSYDSASVVSVVATPNSGYHFVSWSVSGNATVADLNSASTTVTLNGNATVTALFEIDAGGECIYPTWTSGMICVGGDHVIYNGYHWKANWWTSAAPFVQQWGPWTKLEACNH